MEGQKDFWGMCDYETSWMESQSSKEPQNELSMITWSSTPALGWWRQGDQDFKVILATWWSQCQAEISETFPKRNKDNNEEEKLTKLRKIFSINYALPISHLILLRYYHSNNQYYFNLLQIILLIPWFSKYACFLYGNIYWSKQLLEYQVI